MTTGFEFFGLSSYASPTEVRQKAREYRKIFKNYKDCVVVINTISNNCEGKSLTQSGNSLIDNLLSCFLCVSHDIIPIELQNIIERIKLEGKETEKDECIPDPPAPSPEFERAENAPPIETTKNFSPDYLPRSWYAAAEKVSSGDPWDIICIFVYFFVLFGFAFLIFYLVITVVIECFKMLFL